MKRFLHGLALFLSLCALFFVATAVCMIPGWHAASTDAGEVCESFATLAQRAEYARAAELFVGDDKRAERTAESLHREGSYVRVTRRVEHHANDHEYEVIEGTLANDVFSTTTPFACFVENQNGSPRIHAWVVRGQLL